MISPAIWEDPDFNNKSRDTRLAFIGCISNADDDGYLRGDYKSLRRLFYGFDDKDDSSWYEELKTLKNLHFFTFNDETFVHLLNWDKYQAQRDDRRIPSVYPQCDICRASDGQVPAEVKLSKVSKDKLSQVKRMPKNLKELKEMKNELLNHLTIKG